jgi:hypothetical protein
MQTMQEILICVQFSYPLGLTCYLYEIFLRFYGFQGCERLWAVEHLCPEFIKSAINSMLAHSFLPALASTRAMP